jgi:hypothetical protein
MDETRANTDSQNSPRPKLEGSHHLPPYNILCAWSHDQHPNVILSWDSQMGVPKCPKLGLLQLWAPITLCVNLWLRWGLRKSFSPRQDLSNDMSHATCTQRNQDNSWLLVAGSQICPSNSLSAFLLAIPCVWVSKWVMQAHFRHLSSKNFPVI